VVCLALALAVLLAGCNDGGPQTVEKKAVAAAPPALPVPTAPVGDAAKPIVFAWDDRGAGDDVVYRVTVFDAAERLLAERDTRSRRYSAPADVEPLFRPGDAFFWRVAVLDATGHPVRQSPLTRFTIK
jgi:hypothetical protein